MVKYFENHIGPILFIISAKNESIIIKLVLDNIGTLVLVSIKYFYYQLEACEIGISNFIVIWKEKKRNMVSKTMTRHHPNKGEGDFFKHLFY